MGADERGKLGLPPRFDSVVGLREAVLEFYGKHCEIGAFSNVGEIVKLGIVDSVYDPGQGFDETHSIGRKVDLLPDERRDDTTGHGTIVTDLVSTFSENVEYSFYRVVQDVAGGTVWGRHLVEAIGRAHLDHGMDVIDVSLGTDHSSDGNSGCSAYRQPCRARYAARQAVDDGIVVVAAAGNEAQFESVCCPGLASDVVCVGGFVSKCRTRLERSDPMSLGGLESRPPNACWIDHQDKPETDEVYCTGLDCSPGRACENNRENVPWDGNVEAVEGKPDVLAPATVPIRTGDGPSLVNGTSWAAAIVSATVAEVIAGTRDNGETATPEIMRRAIMEGATRLDEGSEKKFSSEGVLQRVYRELDLRFETSPRHSDRTWF